MCNPAKGLAAVHQSLELREATLVRSVWRYEGEDAKRRRELETDNSYPKRLLDEAELDRSILK
jgi:hypothetical protein